MTDRIKGLTVTLESNIRDDDAEAIVSAIKMVKGVVAVDTHVADTAHYMAVTFAKHEMRMELTNAVLAILQGKKIKIVDEKI